MNILRILLALLTPAPPVPHVWKESADGWSRTCTVCGEVHEFDPGSGMCGSAWMFEKEGDRSKHFPIPKERMHNGYSH